MFDFPESNVIPCTPQKVSCLMQQKRSICRSPTDGHYLSDVVGPVDCRSETAAMAELGREVVKVERSIVEGEFQTD